MGHDLHMELHRGELTFQRKYGIDLRASAERLRAWFVEMEGDTAPPSRYRVPWTEEIISAGGRHGEAQRRDL